MSYILDALKKSDRVRPRDAAALPLHEVPEFRTRPRRSRRAVWLSCGLALLLAVAAAGAWVFRSGQQAVREVSGTVSPPVPIAVDASAASADGKSGQGVSPAPTPAPASVATAQQDTAPAADATSSPAQEAPASATREGLLELWQLTDAEQKYLQGLDVSFHVHSNDPSKRAVIINGLRAKEGQALGEDLRLAEIVPDGIVLEFQGQFVHLANPQPY